MSAEKLTETNFNTNHSNGGYYLLLILFILWFSFLMFLLESTKTILPIQIKQNQMVEKQNPIPKVNYLIAKPGHRLLKGDTLGSKLDSIQWQKLNMLEDALKDYSNKFKFLNKIKDIKTGFDSIDRQLNILIESIGIVNPAKQNVPKLQLEKVVSYVIRDNSKIIQNAEKKLKLLQTNYSQKKADYGELVTASQELLKLRQIKETKIEVVKYLPVKKHTYSPEISLDLTKTITAKSEEIILNLTESIKNLKNENVILADREGVLQCIDDKTNGRSCCIVTKYNKRIFEFNNPGIIDLDTIGVYLLNEEGKAVKKLNAVKNSFSDKYILQDLYGDIDQFTLRNKNARIQYNEPRQTYYSWLKDRLIYK
ncbi:MAG TPA: hypothetical protein VK590_03115 [Saprospiraceae bacterium]|nr:hypothetical protein [Saprospiraceae bacterium]